MKSFTEESKDSLETWLAMWDAGKTVWSIEMGGLGPGYEQALQIMVAEKVRWFLKTKPDIAKMKADEEYRKRMSTVMDDAMSASPIISALGSSGAQYGASTSLAWAFYKRGVGNVIDDPKLNDRRIQVGKSFPTVP